MMKMEQSDKIQTRALGWNMLGEATAKLAAPVSSMIVARLVTPESFGIAAMGVLFISLAEILVDSGFQKYIIQHDFKDDTELRMYASAAFSASLISAFIITVLLIIFSVPLSEIVGIAGHSDVICMASLGVPFIALGSVSGGIMRRRLDFRRVAHVRMFVSLTVMLFTITAACLLRDYRAIIAGAVFSAAVTGIGLFVKSGFRPRLHIDLRLIGDMLWFSTWSTLESLAVWLTLYIDLFIVGNALDNHHLGLYRTGMVTGGQLFALVTSTFAPVMFASLSRATDRNDFMTMFRRFQRSASLIIIPLGLAVFFFSDTVTGLLLGPQWGEAAWLIGLWGLTGIPVILVSHFASEVYRSLGRPDWSLLSQLLHIAALVPVVIIFSQYDFGTLCTARALVRLEGVAVNIVMLCLIYRLPTLKPEHENRTL